MAANAQPGCVSSAGTAESASRATAKPGRKTIFVTIDDGPSDRFGSKIALLGRLGIRAIHFCKGSLLELRREEVAEAVRSGHWLGNHSWSHPRFSQLSLEQALAEIESCDRVIDSVYEAAGVRRPARLFRFPYGDRGGALQPSLARHLRRLGFSLPLFANVTYARYIQAGFADGPDVFWTIESREYRGLTAQAVLTELHGRNSDVGGSLNDPSSNDILLIHDHSETTPVFQEILERLVDQGYHFGNPGFAGAHVGF